MMKRMFIVGAAVALVATSAIAAPVLTMVPPSGTATSSSARGVTADGQVVGNSGAQGMYWKAPAASSTQIIAGGAWSFTSTGGLTIRNNGGTNEYVALGMSAGWASTAISTNGTVWAQGVRASSVGSAPGIPASGGVASPKTSDGAYFDVFGSDGNGTNLYVEKISGATPTLVARDAKGTTQKSSIQGVNASGVAVGRRRGDGTNYWIYKLTYTGTGTPGAVYVTGLSGNNFGEGWSVDSAGTIFGMSAVTGGRTGNWPYRNAGTAVELPTLPGTTGSLTNALPYSASPDGMFASGMNYTGHERAVLWYKTQSGAWLEMDLSNYAVANGIIDGFWPGATGNALRRAYSVTTNALGQPVVAGEGVWTPDGGTTLITRGFVMTVDIPEPATLAFLALGGLALLRRRR